MSDKSSNALGLIAIYDSSDSSENDPQDNISDDFLIEDQTFINENKTAEKKFPLPSKIKILFSDYWKKDDLHESNPNLHDGRVRTFAHERGNWSTYVFIP
uniref:U6 snRNA phosphodiesterase 1 n=1 Tax=Clastoptera arizonana TaxID=38151 RepID=A0A1B6DVD8_9HEMI